MEDLSTRLKHAWRIFKGRDSPVSSTSVTTSYTYRAYSRPDRPNLTCTNERTIVNSIINRMAVDAAAVDIRHVIVDEDDVYQKNVKSSLNDCLTFMANLDQTARQFKEDLFITILDKGTAAIVVTDYETPENPQEMETRASWIDKIRVGDITEWKPSTVRVNVYNEATGNKEEIEVPKDKCAIIENPFYGVMNNPNSTLSRLARKMRLLDEIDESRSSNKLNLIIQVPYAVKTDAQKQKAEVRRKVIEDQLNDNKLGIAYADATEKIVQLNRPLENNFLEQIKELTTQLYAQTGMSENIMNGTASEQENVNYFNSTIEPLVSIVALSMNKPFLTAQARAKGHRVKYFYNPFKFVTLTTFADAGDKLSRNGIMSPNELRARLGLKPDQNAASDMLGNRNMPIEDQFGNTAQPQETEAEYSFE